MKITQKLVDRVGTIDAQIEALQAERKEIKATLFATGKQSFEGQAYVVTLKTGDRHTLDMKAVRAKLSPQFIAAHTNVTVVTSMKCEPKPAAVNVVSIQEAA